MVLADSNVLLALAIFQHEFHPLVREWFSRQNASEPVAFCRATQHTLLRLLTTKAVLAPYQLPPLDNRSAWAMYERIRAVERVSWLREPRGLDAHWKKLAGGSKPSPKLWMDAYRAAFAIAGDYQFVTTDNAFTQFKGLDLLILSKD